LVIYGSLETLSGGYLYDRKLVEHLRQQGDTVEVVSLPRRDYARNLGDNLSVSLHRRLAGLHVDLLMQDELNHPSLFWLNRRLRGRVAYPLVSIVHHLRSSELRPGWQNRLYAVVERAYLHSVDGFVYNSQTTRAAVEVLAGTGHPGVVAYPAADHLGVRTSEEEIARGARQPGALRLIFVGNLIPRKGVHTLLAALARLPEGSVHLDICGSLDADAVYAAAIRRQIAALGLQAAVRLHGEVDAPALGDLLRSAQLLVAPSTYEGFGIVYLEAMSFGLPCIGTTVGAASEVIDDGETGFLVPPGDPEALADRLHQLAVDADLRERMALAARRRYLSHPTWERTGAEIRQFLVDLRSYPVPPIPFPPEEGGENMLR
jgi:glycosyltransferase involved in cell wall biosynthesis